MYKQPFQAFSDTSIDVYRELSKVRNEVKQTMDEKLVCPENVKGLSLGVRW